MSAKTDDGLGAGFDTAVDVEAAEVATKGRVTVPLGCGPIIIDFPFLAAFFDFLLDLNTGGAGL